MNYLIEQAAQIREEEVSKIVESYFQYFILKVLAGFLADISIFGEFNYDRYIDGVASEFLEARKRNENPVLIVFGGGDIGEGISDLEVRMTEVANLIRRILDGISEDESLRVILAGGPTKLLVETNGERSFYSEGEKQLSEAEIMRRLLIFYGNLSERIEFLLEENSMTTVGNAKNVFGLFGQVIEGSHCIFLVPLTFQRRAAALVKTLLAQKGARAVVRQVFIPRRRFGTKEEFEEHLLSETMKLIATLIICFVSSFLRLSEIPDFQIDRIKETFGRFTKRIKGITAHQNEAEQPS